VLLDISFLLTISSFFRLTFYELCKRSIDNGYHPEKLKTELEKIYPAIMSKIQFELSPKLSRASKQAQGKSGFILVKSRWVIERSNSWMERCKSLVKNFERTQAHATTKVNLCFLRLMLKRLAIAL
jgi:Transposase DDE domain